MKRMILLSTALIFSAHNALAAITADDLVTSFQTMGYTTIEVTTGLTQIKVEAVLDRTKLEAIYDIASGTILQQETSRAKLSDGGQGVQVASSGSDFLDPNGAGNGDGNGDIAGAGDNSGQGNNNDGKDKEHEAEHEHEHDGGSSNGGSSDGGKGGND